VANALSAYGFSQADWDEGWRLMQAASGKWLVKQTPKVADPSAVEELDAWENRWFPVAQATLRRRHPELHDTLFLNLSQTSGVEVAISVSTFLRRLGQLAEQGSEGEAALKILAERGLTEAVMGEGGALLRKFGTVGFSEPDPKAPELERAEREQAEQTLWAWYLEWSTIARNVIHNRNLLRTLGFMRTPSGRVEESDELEPEVEDEAPESPASAPAFALP
jgi:hypothetical protein